MATHSRNEGNDQNSSNKGLRINIKSTDSNLQFSDNTVIVQTHGIQSSQNQPNIKVENKNERKKKGNFLDNTELNIHSEGGNVSIGRETAVAIINKGESEEERSLSTPEDDDNLLTGYTGKAAAHYPHAAEPGQDMPIQDFSNDDEELQNDLSRDQPPSTAAESSGMGIPSGEPFDRFDSRSGPTALSLGHSVNQPSNEYKRFSDSEGQRSHQYIPKESSSQVLDIGRGKLNAKHKSSEKMNFSSSNSKNPNSRRKYQTNIPLDPSSPEQSPTHGQSVRDVDGASSILQSSEPGENREDDSLSRGSDDNNDDLDLRRNVVIDSSNSTQSTRDKDIHFCVQEKGRWIQIAGECCVIVELNINDKLVEHLKREGEFTAQVEAGDVMVNMRWGDLEKAENSIRSNLKVEMLCHVKKLEREILKELFRNRGEKLIKTVQNVFKKCNSDARIVDVTKGCFQLNFIHLTQESVELLHSEQSVTEIQVFLNKLLITERIKHLAGTSGISLKVTSLRQQMRYINTAEEMKQYQLVARDETPARISQTELRPSDVRHQLQDVSNEVKLIRNTLRSQHEQINENASVLGRQMNELRHTQHSDMERQEQLMAEMRELVGQMMLKMNQLDLKSKSVVPEHESSESEPEQASSDVVSQEPELQETNVGGSLISEEYSIQEQIPSDTTVEQDQFQIQETSPVQIEEVPEMSQLVASGETDNKTSSTYKKQSLDLLLLLFGRNKHIEELQKSNILDEEALKAAAMSLADTNTGHQDVAGASVSVLEHTPERSGFLSQFTDKSIININRIMDSITLAIQVEKDPLPRASGIDTVLCLDTSQSMEGIGITQLKQVVEMYLDGVESNATDRYLEENIAIVTFGESATIEQHLTNEYNNTRDIIENLKIGGQTPLLEALLVSVCAITTKGAPVDVEGYKILPRVVLITDGQVTGCDSETDNVKIVGEDVISTITSVILKMRQNGINYPVTCVPVGDARKTLLKTLAEKTNGQYVTLENAKKLTKHFQIQSVIGKAVAFLQQVNPDGEDISVDDVVNNLTYQQEFDTYDRDFIKKNIYLHLKPQPEILFFDDFCIEQYPELPPLGSRIRRKKKPGHVEGTVVSHTSNCDMEVIWDKGEVKQYSITDIDKEIIVTSPPRVMKATELNPPIGTLVKRGVDWRYGDQDGGIDKIGVVIGIEPGLLRVCWTNERKNFYRFGYEGACDVVILDKANHSLRYPQSGSDLDTDGGIDVKPGLQVTWRWRDDKGSWWKYSKEQMTVIEEAYSKKLLTCVLGTEDSQKRLLLDKMEVRDVGTGIIHEIQREEIEH